MTDTPADEIDAMDLDEVSLEDLSKELIEKYHDFNLFIGNFSYYA